MSLSHAQIYLLVSLSCAVVSKIISQRTSYEMGTRLQVESYKYLIGCYQLFVVANGLGIWSDYARDYNSGFIFTFTSLLSLCACGLFWFRFVRSKLGGAELSGTMNTLLFLPFLLILILVSTSLFTGLIFSYSAEGEYTRGPLYFILAAAPFCYALIPLGRILYRMAVTQSPSLRKEQLYLLLFVLLPVFGAALDYFIPHLPVMELAILTSILLAYISFQDRLIYVDPLTGMHNRRVADKHFTSQLDLASKDNPLLFFLADCDDFKIINDRFGHLEGDRALRIIAGELEKLSIQYNCYVARWGGDEFVLISRKYSIPEPEALIQEFYSDVRERTKAEGLPYDILISVGYVECNDASKGTVEIFAEAESKMYQAKEFNKSERRRKASV